MKKSFLILIFALLPAFSYGASTNANYQASGQVIRTLSIRQCGDMYFPSDLIAGTVPTATVCSDPPSSYPPAWDCTPPAQNACVHVGFSEGCISLYTDPYEYISNQSSSYKVHLWGQKWIYFDENPDGADAYVYGEIDPADFADGGPLLEGSYYGTIKVTAFYDGCP